MRRSQTAGLATLPSTTSTFTDDRSKRPIYIALIGHDLDRWSLPALHMSEAQAMGLDLQVDPLDPRAMVRARPHLVEMLDMLPLLGFAGACIASPYKRAAVAHVDELTPSARAAGAVTTMVFRDNARIGHNTTSWAFRENLRRVLGHTPPGRVLVLGAGPSGAAAGHALRDLGATALMIDDPQADRADALALDLDGTRVTDLEAAAAAADGIVNASPRGGVARPGSAIPTELLRPHHWVADLSDNPTDTELVRAARARGCRTFDGNGVAVFRALRDFHLLTGRAPDVKRLRATIRQLQPPLRN